MQSIVSVIVNLHREGPLAVPTLRGLGFAIRMAERLGILVEVIAVADRPDPATLAVVEQWGEYPLHQLTVDYGDLGLSRNHGVKAANGDYIGFLDADDLFCENWLVECVELSRLELNRRVVLHPEVNIYFGISTFLRRHIDMESAEFSKAALLDGNQWTALSFAKKSIYLDHPYSSTDLVRGIGYEDWAWHLETMAAGVVHKVVPGTVHAIRQKEVSLVQQTKRAGAIPRPAPIFRPLIIL